MANLWKSKKEKKKNIGQGGIFLTHLYLHTNPSIHLCIQQNDQAGASTADLNWFVLEAEEKKR